MGGVCKQDGMDRRAKNRRLAESALASLLGKKKKKGKGLKLSTFVRPPKDQVGGGRESIEISSKYPTHGRFKLSIFYFYIFRHGLPARKLPSLTN